MNILLLNRHKDQSLINCYAKALKSRKHEVVNLCQLADEPKYAINPIAYLSQFDLAIVHPTPEDVRILHDELLRRNSFRVVIYNIEGVDEMNGRLKHATPLSSEDLFAVIER